MKRSIQEIKDILLSKRNNGSGNKGQDKDNDYKSYKKKNKYKQNYEIIKRIYLNYNFIF
jgi:hypothetical protein